MEIRDYCKNVNMELDVWRSRLHDVIDRIDHLPTGSKQRMYEEVNGLHILMSDLEERIEKLRTECPTSWSPRQEEASVNLTAFGSRYNDTSGVRFDYDFGG